MDVVDKIFLLLDSKCIEQKEFAKGISVHRNVVSDWRIRKSKSYLKYIDRIAEYLGVPSDYLLIDETRRKKTELRPEEDAIILLKQALVKKGVITQTDSLSENQIHVLVDFISDNSKTIKKLFNYINSSSEMQRK